MNFFENLRNPAHHRHAGLMCQFRPSQVHSIYHFEDFEHADVLDASFAPKDRGRTTPHAGYEHVRLAKLLAPKEFEKKVY
jgi:hypothetical protein